MLYCHTKITPGQSGVVCIQAWWWLRPIPFTKQPGGDGTKCWLIFYPSIPTARSANGTCKRPASLADERPMLWRA